MKDVELLPVVWDSVVGTKDIVIDCNRIIYFPENKTNTYMMVGGFNINEDELREISSKIIDYVNENKSNEEEIEKLPEAEQKYLTGMAYYSGRGPKVDRNKAIELIEAIEDLIGTDIHRYAVFSTDAVCDITNGVGKIEYLIPYKFI